MKGNTTPQYQDEALWQSLAWQISECDAQQSAIIHMIYPVLQNRQEKTYITKDNIKNPRSPKKEHAIFKTEGKIGPSLKA